MAKEVWKRIQTAEAEARRIIEEAKLQSASIIRQAREEAAELVNQAETWAISDGEKMLAEKRAAAQEMKQTRLNQVDSELQQLVRAGESKLSGAVNLLMEKVVS